MASTLLTLDTIVKNTPDLPAFPEAALAVMKETDSPTGTAQSVARILAQDSSLAVRVLRLANSAYYSLARRVMDVPEAVVVLGMRCVKNLALVAGTYPWMSRSLKGYAMGPSDLWAQSLCAACGARVIAEHTRKVSVDEAFTAGLLHNLGKVVLSVWLENRSSLVLGFDERDNSAFDELERQILGFDHTEVGEKMAESWNLPTQLIHVIRHHHAPSELDPAEPLVDCVHVADYFSMCLGYGLGIDGMRYAIDPLAFERLGLSEDTIDKLLAETAEAYERHEKLFEENDR